MLTSALTSYNSFGYPFSSRGLGVWFFNARSGCYTFLPFYYGWGSPYGSSYSTSIYYPPAYTGSTTYNPSAGGSGNGQGGYPNGGGTSGGGRPPAPTPPSSGGFGDGGSSGGFGGREPRMVNPDTGNPMPRKNLEKMPGQP
jgi:hypothetical protein